MNTFVSAKPSPRIDEVQRFRIEGEGGDIAFLQVYDADTDTPIGGIVRGMYEFIMGHNARVYGRLSLQQYEPRSADDPLFPMSRYHTDRIIRIDRDLYPGAVFFGSAGAQKVIDAHRAERFTQEDK